MMQLIDQNLGDRALGAFEYIRGQFPEARTIGDQTFVFDQDVETGAATVIVQLLLRNEYVTLHPTFMPRKLTSEQLAQLGNRPRIHGNYRWFHADSYREGDIDDVVWVEHIAYWGKAVDGGRHTSEEMVEMIRGTLRSHKACGVCGGKMIDPIWRVSGGNEMSIKDIPSCPHCKSDPGYRPFEWEVR